jgi:O-antigen biosynthesis protein
MPFVSVFTPSHNPEWLDDCYASLKAQTYENWEWVVLLNKGAKWAKPNDERVWVHESKELNIGALKREAVAASEGRILVELDHDDTLEPDALEEIVRAFDDNPEVIFVYGNTAQMDRDGSPNLDLFDATHGWTYNKTDEGYLVARSFAPLPSNVSYIWYAPNHPRAFLRSAYEAVGGYNASLDICDDQDLMNRLYQRGPFHQLNQLLYKQRIHEHNTQTDPEKNLRIQRKTVELYDQNVQANALAWAKRENLLALDLGGAYNSPDGYISVDIQGDVDMKCDISEGLPYPDNSVGVIRAVDFLEHIPNQVALINECYRVLAHGGMMLTLTPSTDGRGAFQDPTHVSFWNENSFWYYTDDKLRRYVPEITARFKASRLHTYYPSDWHESHNILYVCANLVAIKDGPPIAGRDFA